MSIGGVILGYVSAHMFCTAFFDRRKAISRKSRVLYLLPLISLAFFWSSLGELDVNDKIIGRISMISLFWVAFKANEYQVRSVLNGQDEGGGFYTPDNPYLKLLLRLFQVLAWIYLLGGLMYLDFYVEDVAKMSLLDWIQQLFAI